MLPWSPIVLGIAHALSSRAVSDGIDVDYKTAKKFNDKIDSVSNWVDLLDGVDISKPQTVISAALEVSKKAVNAKDSKMNQCFKDMANRGYTPTYGAISWIIEDLICFIQEREDDLDSRVGCEEVYGDTSLNYFRVKGEHKLYYIESGEFITDSDTIFVPVDPDDSFRDAVSDVIWEDEDIFMLDINYDEPYLAKLDIESNRYFGDKLKYIDRWRDYIDKGKNRTVLLQGKSGTGKTTFSNHVRKEISEKTLEVSHEAIKFITVDTWQDIVYWLDPFMVIVDDIDRMGKSIDSKLRFFEDGYYDVPLTMLTSNNFMNMPSAARRCGRIDQILAMSKPDRSIVEKKIIRFAEEAELIDEGEGLDGIPDDDVEFLVEVHDDNSGAGLREAINRLKVDGFGYRPSEDDITFSNLSEDVDSEIFESDKDYFGKSNGKF